MFNPTTLNLTYLHSPNSYTIPQSSTQAQIRAIVIQWCNDFCLANQNYFIAGMTTPYNDGTSTYTQLAPLTATNYNTFLNNVINLFTETPIVPKETFGQILAGYICDFWGSFLTIGQQQLNSYPNTVTPWNPIVTSSLALSYLSPLLNTLYTNTNIDIATFVSQLQTYLDTGAKMCYLQFPSNFLQ